MQFINGGIPHTKTETQLYLNTLLFKTDKLAPFYNYWLAFTKAENIFIGWFIIKPLDNTEMSELGYRLMQAAWGKGYATEGSKRLLSFAFDVLRLERINAVTLSENVASRRVMEKCGMQFQENGYFYGKKCVRYVIEKPDWQKLAADC